MNHPNAFSIIIKRLFGSWGRALATFSFVIGIASPIISFYILDPQGIPPFIIMRDIGLLALLVAMILVLAYGNARKDVLHKNKLIKLSKEIENWEKIQLDLQYSLASQLEHANHMMQRATQVLFHHYRDIFLEKANIEVFDDEVAAFNKMCLSVTTHVRESITTHLQTMGIEIGNDIAVTVKLMLPLSSIKESYPDQYAKEPRPVDPKDFRVITVFRDNKTWDDNKISGKRGVGNALYTIEDNTAFGEIVIGRKGRFQSNNLSKLQRDDHYQNQTLDWEQHYNSTLVVPMVLQETVNVPRDQCRYVGFLAVDSLNPCGKNLYDNEECYHILNHAALILSNFFLVLILYHDKK